MSINYFFIIIITIIITLVILIDGRYFTGTEEGFTANLGTTYRPQIRKLRTSYDNIVNNYGADAIAHKFNKWNMF